MELAVEAKARELEQRARARSAVIAHGMAQARAQGIYVGCPTGGEDTEAFLAKPTSQRVVAVLREQPDLSIRNAAQVAGVSINTVRKVVAVVGYIFC